MFCDLKKARGFLKDVSIILKELNKSFAVIILKWFGVIFDAIPVKNV